ncbi:MAG: exodeoxyribonuclease VII large subunit [Limisphaerales bacterium]
MPRSSKSQWDFGDLFAPRSGSAGPTSTGRTRTEVPKAVEVDPNPPAGRPAVISVSELTQGIKRHLESRFGFIRVSGEISNHRLQASGHAYFVLKDATAQLGCVLFRSQSAASRVSLRDGLKVILGGELSVYEPQGKYQLRVTSVELEGIGALQAAFERLKARLQAEGLFDAARKRPIPAFPRRVGLVTSPTGAAIRDVLHVVGRRFAGLEFVLVPVRVQGEGAAPQIAEAIGSLNEWERAHPGSLDAILVTRGGGSLEDLWAFNEEVVARAISASAVPVISAVGHEIDFTIADLVADLRAATPSAAGELLTAGYVEAVGRLSVAARRLRVLTARTILTWGQRAESWVLRLERRHPRRQLETRIQQLDDTMAALVRGAGRGVRDAGSQVSSVVSRLLARRPQVVLERDRRRLLDVRRRLAAAVSRHRDRLRSRSDRAAQSLRLLSPLQVLERGYSLTFEPSTGQLVRRVEGLRPGQRLQTRLADGVVDSVVEQVTPGRS